MARKPGFAGIFKNISGQIGMIFRQCGAEIIERFAVIPVQVVFHLQQRYIAAPTVLSCFS